MKVMKTRTRLLIIAAATAAVCAQIALGAVTDTNTRVDATADGIATAYTFTFPTQKAADVAVYVNGVKQTVGFAVAINVNQSSSPGGTVTFTPAPSAAAVIRIQRETPKKQETVYTPYSAFPAKTTEKALDRGVGMVQELARDLTDTLNLTTTAQAAADHATYLATTAQATANTGVANAATAQAAADAAQGTADTATGLANTAQSTADGAAVSAAAASVSAAASASSASSSATSASASAASSASSAASSASSASTAAAVAASVAAGTAGGNDTLVTTTGGSAAIALKDHFTFEVNVKDFGAKGDNSTDDTAAIQAAIDSVRPGATVANSASYYGMSKVFFPKGKYIVSSSIKTYSGVWLSGVGHGSWIKAHASFPAGDPLVKASTDGTVPAGYYQGKITDLHFYSTGITGVWAFSHSEMSSAGTLTAEHLLIETPKGLNLTPYTQNTSVRDVLYMGPVDQMLYVKGNFNIFEQLDKEGSTGTTLDPYILVTSHGAGQSHSNHFKEILIEQITSANKTLIEANGTDALVLEDIWMEPTATDGYGVRLTNSADFQIRGNFGHLTSITKVKVGTASWGAIETVNSDGEDAPWTNHIEVDPNAVVHIGKVFTRRTADNFRLDQMDNVSIGNTIDRTLLWAPYTGISPLLRVEDQRPENMLLNPSFEGGVYGWCKWGGTCPLDYTYTLDASEVADGLMMHITSVSITNNIYQTISIPAAWVGQTLTFSYLVKITGAGYAAAGIDCPSGQAIQRGRAYAGAGWEYLAVTFQPQAAGTCYFQAWLYSANLSTTHWYIDEAKVGFGTIATAAGGRFKQLELSSRSLLMATAAPTTGTWKKGDLVFNSNPSAGSALGWRAITAGTPGTWEPMYVHTTAQ